MRWNNTTVRTTVDWALSMISDLGVSDSDVGCRCDAVVPVRLAGVGGGGAYVRRQVADECAAGSPCSVSNTTGLVSAVWPSCLPGLRSAGHGTAH